MKFKKIQKFKFSDKTYNLIFGDKTYNNVVKGTDIQYPEFLMKNFINKKIISNFLQNCSGLILRECFYDSLDARSMSFKKHGFIGVDFRLNQLIYYSYLAILACRKLKDFTNSSFSRYGIIDISQELCKIIRNYVCNGNICTFLNIKDADKECLDKLYFFLPISELFIILHEIGHIIIENKKLSIITSNKLHSCIQSYGLSIKNKQFIENIENFIAEEVVCDRFSSMLLKKILINKKNDERIHDIILCVIFHLIELINLDTIITQNSKFLAHPNPFVRLGFCKVDYRYYEPHVKFKSLEPFSSIIEIFDHAKYIKRMELMMLENIEKENNYWEMVKNFSLKNEKIFEIVRSYEFHFYGKWNNETFN